MSEIQRIAADLAQAKRRVTDAQARAVPTHSSEDGQPLSWHSSISTQTHMPNGELQRTNQVAARIKDVQRLEMEYVQAMLSAGSWPAGMVIEAVHAWSTKI